MSEEIREKTETTPGNAVAEDTNIEESADEALVFATEEKAEEAEITQEDAGSEAADGESEAAEQQAAAEPAFDADAYLDQLAEAKRSITAGIVIYKGRINEKLQERSPEGYDAVAAIVNEPQYDRVAQYDQELTTFKSTGQIYQMEAGTEPITIYDRIEYIDSYRMIYEQMMFFIRRMAFGLDYTDCMMWLKEWGLSVHFVIQMLLESEVSEKGRVAGILAGLYEAEGLKKEALFLLNVMKDHCLAEEKSQILEKLEALQE